MVSVLEEHSRRAVGWVRGVGAVGAGILVALAIVEGVGRAVFDLHLAGIAAVTGAWITAYAFLLLADANAHGRVVRVSRFDDWIVARSPLSESVRQIAVGAISAVVLLFTGYACATSALEIWRAPDQFSDPGEPSAFIASALAVIALGAVLAAVHHLRALIDELVHLNPSAVPKAGRNRLYGYAALWALAFALVVWAGAMLIAGDVEWTAATVVAVGVVVLALLAGGLQVAIAMMLFFPFVAGFTPEPDVARVYLLGTEAAIVPVFILLALAFKAAGLTADLGLVARWVFRRAGTGEGLAALWGLSLTGAMSALTDDHTARAAARDIPSMVRAGFWPRSAVGIVVAGGVLGSVLPPSLLVALYAMDSHTGAFATAGSAALMLLVVFSFMVVSRASLRGEEGGGAPAPDLSAGALAVRAVRVLAVPGVVLAAIFSERLTLAEGGALAIVLSLAIGIVSRRLSLPEIWSLLTETGRLAVPILFLLVAGGVYAWLLTATGVVQFATVAAATPGAAVFGFAALVALVVLLRWLGLGAISVLMLLFPLWLPLMKVVSGTLAPDVFGILLLLFVQMVVMVVPTEGLIQAVRRAIGDPTLARRRIAASAAPFAAVIVIVGVLLVGMARLGWFGA